MNLERYIELLESTERKGIKDLTNYLKSSKIELTPASTRYHLAKEGGLIEHSLNVYDIATKINKELETEIEEDTIILISLLHDIGKHLYYNKPQYIDKYLKNGKKGVQPYETNKDLIHVPHEIKSIQIISQFIELTEEETFAILYHNGMYGPLKYELQGKESKEYLILHFADMWTSRIIEK